MAGFYIQIFCDFNNKYSVIIEDNQKVCYAYLLEHEHIIGDVWLYNSITTPLNVDWSSKSEMPFLNPSKFVDEKLTIQPIQASEEVKVFWSMADADRLKEVTIVIKEVSVAKLVPGSKPGWSLAVKKDGPLAKKLVQ